MSEELDKNQDEEILESQEEQAPEEIEQEEGLATPETEEKDELKEKAKAFGHLSQDEYLKKHGSLDGYKSEREFALTGDLIDLKKTLQKRDQDIEEILTYQKNTIAQQKANFKRQLDEQLAEARSLGNVDAVERLSVQKTHIELEDRQEEAARSTQAQLREVQNFVDRNKYWFNESNPDLIARVKELDAIYTNTCKTYEELSSKIEKHMKAEMGMDPRYAHLVRAKESSSSGPNLTSSQSSVNKQASAGANQSDDKLYSKLTANEKAMYNINKRIAAKVNETYSVKEFINDIKADGEI